ncbi:MAG: pectate lyase [Gemmatimonadaceae bacterium]
MIAARWSLLAGGWLFCANARAQANPNPMDSIRRLPSYRESFDTVQLITDERIAKYAGAKRAKWTAYVRRSRDRYTADTIAMRAELRGANTTSMTRAPYTHDFSVKPFMTAAWFRTDTARRMAGVILSFQAPNGGWSKHVDFALRPRAKGESFYAESADWEWISTVDNDATTEEIRFLALADKAHHDGRYGAAISRGIDYLLDSQYPNGCFPQVYPLEGSYHDAATFNDNATVNAMRLLRDVGAGEYRIASRAQVRRAQIAIAAGLDCIVNAQVVVNGTLTAWGQQHDPLTLAPTSARSYELTSITALESAEIVDYLMSLESPSSRVASAVYAATDWLRAVPIHGYTYARYELKPSAAAPPLWGRLYEIGTNRVIMANRDGIKLYDWNKLTDRRSGYGWYTTKPADTLARFTTWSASHPRPQ